MWRAAPAIAVIARMTSKGTRHTGHHHHREDDSNGGHAEGLWPMDLIR
jgi:hypothetical protein